MKSVEEGVKMNQKELVMKEVVDQEEDREFNEKQEKVIAIVEAYNSGDKELRDWAMTEMLQETQGFIGKIINKHFYNYKKDYYQEMYQAGALAVFENMGKYDVTRGTLTTYFTSYILHEITEFISRETSHSTPYYANMMSQIKEAIKYFESKHKVPSETDIALYTNLSLRNVQEGLNRIHALDEFRYDYDSELERQLAEENRNSGFDLPENRVIQDELSEVLYACKCCYATVHTGNTSSAELSSITKSCESFFKERTTKNTQQSVVSYTNQGYLYILCGIG